MAEVLIDTVEKACGASLHDNPFFVSTDDLMAAHAVGYLIKGGCRRYRSTTAKALGRTLTNGNLEVGFLAAHLCTDIFPASPDVEFASHGKIRQRKTGINEQDPIRSVVAARDSSTDEISQVCVKWSAIG